MNELEIARRLLARVGQGVAADTPLAKALLEWARKHAGWLADAPAGRRLGWADTLAAAGETRPDDAPLPYVLQLADALAGPLGFDPFDRDLLAIAVALERLPRLTALAAVVAKHGSDLPTLLGAMAGAPTPDAARQVRRSAAYRLGLVGFSTNRLGEIEVDLGWALHRLLDHAPLLDDALIDALLGARQAARLSLDDFACADAGFLVRLLRGALAERAAGINILVHGPPGTGKTELARTLAADAGAPLHAVGEADEDGEEPTRWDRVKALHLAQRVLADRGGAVLLFDEMEDLIGDARPSGGDWVARREGSKVFVNRLLEANPAPVIWTTNAIGNVDGAILRRMSFVVELALPTPGAARRMLDRIAGEEGGEPAGLASLVARAPEAATVLRTALRAGRLAADDPARPAASLVRALRGGELPAEPLADVDLDLLASDPPLGPVIEALVARGATDVSLLLSGPPGTGKTALAHHLARALDRPLLVKRASDLLSRWVGGTEAAIAEAFAEARRYGGVLLFDEVDSLLFDRATARTSWEAGQVNELLTWLDHHPLPVIAATNAVWRLDPATLRRFVFKVALCPLDRDAAARAFARFFGLSAPAALADLGNLTPGDFALVARQLRHAPAPDAATIVDRLRAEADAKPESGARLGFG